MNATMKRLCSLVYRLELIIDEWNEATEEEHENVWLTTWTADDVETFAEIKADWFDDERAVRLCNEILTILDDDGEV